MPPAFMDAYVRALSEPETSEQALAMFTRFGALAGCQVKAVESEIIALATELHTSPMIQSLFAEVELPAAADHSAPGISLDALVPDPAQRMVLTTVFELIAAEGQPADEQRPEELPPPKTQR